MPQERLLTVPLVSLSLVSDPNEVQGDASELFRGALSLDLVDLPPSLPPRTSKSSSSLISLDHQAIPGSFQRSRSPSPSPSPTGPPTERRQFVRMGITLPDDPEPIFSMPVVSPQTSASEANCYYLPNLTGTDPATLFPDTQDHASFEKYQNGWIRLEVDRDRSFSSAEQREYFESILVSSGRPSSSRISPAPPPSFDTLERNQLYVVDESNGRVLGQLDHGTGLAEDRISLEEDAQVANGEMHDNEDAPSEVKIDTFNLDGKEAVVINSLVSENASSSSAKPTWNASRFSVKPLSAYYSPAPNPDKSTIISVGNFISHGLVIGSSLISQGLEKSAGHYVSTRPATNTPLVFKETTKKNWEASSRVTAKAVQYSGQATGYVGKFATQFGDKIGKATGIQSKPGSGSSTPSGLRGLVAKSLIALNTVGDHLDASGKTLLDSGSKSASQVVHHKWGSEARGVVDDAGASVKHCALVYIDARGVTRRALIKAVGKGALKAKMADGSQLYLTDSSDNSEYELQQIEQAATSLEKKQIGSATTTALDSSSTSNPGLKTRSTNPFDDERGEGGGGASGSPPSYTSNALKN